MQGLPAGSGIFVVCDATNGAPLAIFQENRFLTDLRTGAAGAVSVKHFAARHHKKVGFVGAGVIAAAMARGSKCVHEFDEGFAYGLDPERTRQWAEEIEAELGYKVHVCETAEECVRQSDVVFTQTPGSETVRLRPWIRVVFGTGWEGCGRVWEGRGVVRSRSTSGENESTMLV